MHPQSLTSADSPHQSYEKASGKVLSVTGAVTECYQGFWLCFFFLLLLFGSTYLLTSVWKAPMGLWCSNVLVWSSERSNASSVGCVCSGNKGCGSTFLLYSTGKLQFALTLSPKNQIFEPLDHTKKTSPQCYGVLGDCYCFVMQLLGYFRWFFGLYFTLLSEILNSY